MTREVQEVLVVEKGSLGVGKREGREMSETEERQQSWGFSKRFGIGIPGLIGVTIWFGELVVILVTDVERKPIGLLNLDLKRGYVERGLVLESYRRKGIFTSLMGEAERIAKERGLDRLSLTTDLENEAIVKASKKMGYSELRLFEKRLDTE